MTTALVDNPTTTVVEPATVTWIGTSGNWYDSANWSTGQVPTANDIVTINNTTKGTTYNISFSNGTPVYGGLNLLTSNGGILKLSGLTNYLGSSRSDTKIEATGQGSLIDLSSLTTLKGGQSLNVLNINSLQGGEINFGGLTKITGGTTEVVADGAGSTINLAQLTEFTDNDFDRSLLKTRNGGLINLAKVNKLREVDLSSDNSVLYLESLTNYIGDNQVEAFNGGQISLIKLNKVSGQILQVTATGNKSRIVISEQLAANKYLAQERSGGDVIVSNNSSALNYQPIVKIPISAQNTNEDQAFSFTVPSNTFADLDPSDSLTYTATLSNNSALPSWLKFNAATRTFSGTPNNDQVGTFNVNVKATDRKGLTASTPLTLTVVNVNDAPIIANAIADQSTTVAENFSFTFAANTFLDVDAGDVLNYSVTKPAWLTFNPTTRTFSGIATNTDLGTININVTATDLSGAKVTDTFALSVARTTINYPPTLENEINPQTATENQLFTFQVPENTFQDINDDPLTYTANLDQIGIPDLPLPSWLTFDEATRTFSGIPTNADVGLINLNVVAADPSREQAVETFALTIVDTPNNPPVVNIPILSQSTLEDQLFTFSVPTTTFSDLDVGTLLTYTAASADGTPLPTWLTFDPLTKSFTGTPGNENVGTFSLAVTATDPEGANVSSVFNLTVNNVNDPPLVVNSIPDQGAIINRSFSYDIPGNTFTDIDAGDSLTYTATLYNVPVGGNNTTPLPNWLNFNPNTLTFTATPTVADYGVLPIALTATDQTGASTTTNFNLTVDIDAAQYGASYGDLITAFGYDLPALSQHYREFGRNEGRNPDTFDEYRYLAGYDDLLNAPEIGKDAGKATEHYIRYGSQFSAGAEGRDPLFFKSDIYLASYDDLIKAIEPINNDNYASKLEFAGQHYVLFGRGEGRAKKIFDPILYLADYPDVAADPFYGNNPTRHYLEYGYAEGRGQVHAS